jgi:mRNA interferase RelE/StbE
VTYEINWKPRALRDLRKLDQSVVRRILPAVSRLAHDPRPPGVVALAGQQGLLRLRIGDYRVIYSVEDARLVVVVVEVGHRREIYR